MDRVEKLLKYFTYKTPSVKLLPYLERLKTFIVNSEQRRLEIYRIIYVWKILQCLVPNCGVKEVNTEADERWGRRCLIPKLKKQTKPASRNSEMQVIR